MTVRWWKAAECESSMTAWIGPWFRFNFWFSQFWGHSVCKFLWKYAMHYGLLKLNVPGVLHQPILGLTKIKRKRLSPRSSWLYKDGNISCHWCSPSEHSSNPSTSPFLLIEDYSDSCSHWGSTFPTLPSYHCHWRHISIFGTVNFSFRWAFFSSYFGNY